MSSYYICDTCDHRAGSVEMGNYCCLAPGMGRITYKTRKAITDQEENPLEVCRHFVPRKEKPWER